MPQHNENHRFKKTEWQVAYYATHCHKCQNFGTFRGILARSLD